MQLDAKAEKVAEALIPRLLSFLVREQRLAARYVLAATGANTGEVVEEWSACEDTGDDQARLAKDVLEASFAYAANVEARAELVLRAISAGEVVRGSIRYRVPWTQSTPDFSNADGPEAKLIRFLLETVNKQQGQLATLPARTTETYEKLLAALARDNGKKDERIHELETEVRMLYEALRQDANISDETVKAAHEASETKQIVAEGVALAKEIVGAVVANKAATAAPAAAASSAANGAAAAAGGAS